MKSLKQFDLLTGLAFQIEQIKNQKLNRIGAIARQVQALAEKRLEDAIQQVNDDQLQALGWSSW